MDGGKILCSLFSSQHLHKASYETDDLLCFGTSSSWQWRGTSNLKNINVAGLLQQRAYPWSYTRSDWLIRKATEYRVQPTASQPHTDKTATIQAVWQSSSQAVRILYGLRYFVVPTIRVLITKYLLNWYRIIGRISCLFALYETRNFASWAKTKSVTY